MWFTASCCIRTRASICEIFSLRGPSSTSRNWASTSRTCCSVAEAAVTASSKSSWEIALRSSSAVCRRSRDRANSDRALTVSSRASTSATSSFRAPFCSSSSSALRKANSASAPASSISIVPVRNWAIVCPCFTKSPSWTCSSSTRPSTAEPMIAFFPGTTVAENPCVDRTGRFSTSATFTADGPNCAVADCAAPITASINTPETTRCLITNPTARLGDIASETIPSLRTRFRPRQTPPTTADGSATAPAGDTSPASRAKLFRSRSQSDFSCCSSSG